MKESQSWMWMITFAVWAKWIVSLVSSTQWKKYLVHSIKVPKSQIKTIWIFFRISLYCHMCAKLRSPNDSKLDRTSLNWPLQHHKTKVKQHHRLYILRVLVQSIRSGPLKVRAANQCGGVCWLCFVSIKIPVKIIIPK